MIQLEVLPEELKQDDAVMMEREGALSSEKLGEGL